MNTPSQPSTPESQRLFKTLWFIYLFLLIYGTLFPIGDWDWEQGSISRFFSIAVPENVSKADFVMNLIVYVPFGFLGVLVSQSRRASAIIMMGIAGLCLSFCLEFFQQFLPQRVTSLSDVLLNTLGSFAGAWWAFLFGHSAVQKRLHLWAKNNVSDKPLSKLGLFSVCLWSSAQLSPFVPSIELSYLLQGVSPLLRTLTDFSLFNVKKYLAEALLFSVYMIIARTSLVRSPANLKLILLFFSGVLLLKIPVLSRQISLENLLAMLSAFLVLLVTYQIKYNSLKHQAFFAALASYCISSLVYGNNDALHEMNWIPFAQQMNTLVGIDDLIAQIALFSAISFLMASCFPQKKEMLLLWGSVFLIIFVFGLEWSQQYIPGRYSDITDVVIAFSTWLVFITSTNEYQSQAEKPITKSRRRSKSKMSAYIIGAGFFAPVLLLIFWNQEITSSNSIQAPAYNQPLYTLPEINELPAVNLPGFMADHPRLPSPDFSDIRTLQMKNPLYFKNKRISAQRGDINARILIAYTSPGEIDLNRLHEDLMALKFSGRGQAQTNPIAVAYDWLYLQWTHSQQSSLRRKLVEACDYQIHIIRNKMALSPYNVFLYNSPFQSMMMAAIALHKDIPEQDDLCMRFTHDYWKNRVLPVWRQVMGKNGGWHEGAEYVAIGIGKAVYKVPAMWRAATGEDYLLKESGISGFLDFLVYRTRPDGSHIRWGDGMFFNRKVQDKNALAIELNHFAAYSLHGCPEENMPSSYPWGPLTSNYYCLFEAEKKLPLTKWFDGIGMVIARSSWEKDATYVVFKTGDNYWSHTHLDQGAFTIFKGAPLAIDSGVYHGYGSDHHKNYMYQSIAHNVITVTDPEDNLPLLSKKNKKNKKPRSIANDGGQRRVGSGWGRRAPLDIHEWNQHIDDYHTGKIERFYEDKQFVVAIANLTPAYTNSKSGTGTFHARTRRVEDYWRIFVYDRVFDAVLIFDNITATDESFTKRSIFHSLNRPYMVGNRITTRAEGRARSNQVDGVLDATVLFPRQSYINIIGGKGNEFFVGYKNYDEKGKLSGNMDNGRKYPVEPGKWRVEVIPSNPQKQNQFLTVYDPKLSTQEKEMDVLPISDNEGVGAELKQKDRSHLFMFSKQSKQLTIHIHSEENKEQEIVISNRPQ